MVHEYLSSLCHDELVKTNIAFYSWRPHQRWTIGRLVRAWNSRRLNKIQVCEKHEHGSISSLENCEGGETPKLVYIRLRDHRWHGYDYSQEPVVSTSSTQSPCSMSAIVQIDIEPVDDSRTLADPLPVKSTTEPLYTDDEPIEEKVKYVRETSHGYDTFAEQLSLYTEVFGVPRNEFLRSNVNEYIDKQAELIEIASTITRDVGNNFTEAEELVCRIMWGQRDQVIKQKNNKNIKQQNNKDVKQKQHKDVKKQEKEQGKQKGDGDAKQKDAKDAEQN
jgi:hypothetical protein